MKRVPTPALPKELAKLDEEYTCLRDSGRDQLFLALRGHPHVLAVLGEGITGARGAKPALQATVRPALPDSAFSLQATVQSKMRTVSFSRTRAAGVLEAAVERARAGGQQYIWMPLQLTAADELHANVLWIDRQAHHVVLFEPHGRDSQDDGQVSCGFRNYYDSESYFAAVRALVQSVDAIAGWELLLPSHYEPRVFGQSCSDVRGPGQGDPWCVLWTLVFLHYVTWYGTPAQFVAAVEYRRQAGTLRATMVQWLSHRADWLGKTTGLQV